MEISIFSHHINLT